KPARLKPGQATYRAGRFRRLDRRPRDGVRSGGTLAVNVAGLAVTAYQEFFVLADCGRATDLPAGAPDKLGVVADLLNVAGAAIVRKDARPVVFLLGNPEAHHLFRGKGARRAGPQIFALRFYPSLVGRMLEPACPGEFVSPDPRIRG